MNTTFIYALLDPISKNIRYIGKSNNPIKRFKEHINKSKLTVTHKNNWILKLSKNNLKPILCIIDEVSIKEWVFWETYWISQCKTWGFNLVNTTEGGDGCSLTNKGSFNKGSNCVPIIAVNKTLDKFYQFKSTKDASDKLNINAKNIYSALSKKSKTKTSRGLFWMKLSEYEKVNKKDFKYLVKNAFYKKPFKGNKTSFKKGNVPWLKNKKGIKQKPDKNVYQYSGKSGKFLKKWNNSKEAGNTLSINPFAITACCRKSIKTSGGYVWRYNYYEKVEKVTYNNMTNNKIKSSLR